jgi:tRNA(fMet)-specific endonuclease VapC
VTLYLLDSNALSALIHHPQGAVAQRAGLVGEAQICTSIIAAAEIWYGVHKKRSSRLTHLAAQVLQSLPTLPFDEPAEQVYGRVRVALETLGTPIGYHDTLIASHALALGCILVTDNEREFRRVSDLRVENWLRPA